MKTIIIAAVAAVLATCATAFAETSHILGHDGPVVALDAMCHRVVTPAPGETLEFSVNVTAQQVKCLIRRPDPFAQCVKHLGPAPSVSIWRKDDWKGVDKLRNYVNNLAGCSKAHL